MRKATNNERPEIAERLDSILAGIADQEIIASLRYGGADEVRARIRGVRKKLETLRNGLNGKTEAQ
jgi:hypothetical protein